MKKTKRAFVQNSIGCSQAVAAPRAAGSSEPERGVHENIALRRARWRLPGSEDGVSEDRCAWAGNEVLGEGASESTASLYGGIRVDESNCAAAMKTFLERQRDRLWHRRFDAGSWPHGLLTGQRGSGPRAGMGRVWRPPFQNDPRSRADVRVRASPASGRCVCSGHGPVFRARPRPRATASGSPSWLPSRTFRPCGSNSPRRHDAT